MNDVLGKVAVRGSEVSVRFDQTMDQEILSRGRKNRNRTGSGEQMNANDEMFT